MRHRGMGVGLCPLAKPLFDSLAERVYTLEESSSFASQIRIGRSPFYHTMGEIEIKYRTDVFFGQHTPCASRVSAAPALDRTAKRRAPPQADPDAKHQPHHPPRPAHSTTLRAGPVHPIGVNVKLRQFV